jgi:hypothetical protein
MLPGPFGTHAFVCPIVDARPDRPMLALSYLDEDGEVIALFWAFPWSHPNGCEETGFSQTGLKLCQETGVV